MFFAGAAFPVAVVFATVILVGVVFAGDFFTAGVRGPLVLAAVVLEGAFLAADFLAGAAFT
jgi:hypothetical protein